MGLPKKATMSETHVKYPRTPRLPWSRDDSDDEMLSSVEHFIGKEVVVSEKLDGENSNFYRDHVHARSIDSKPHPSRTWVKNLWGRIRFDIPEHFRICGENLFAAHSIFYDSLDSYFQVFNIWEGDFCLSWVETVEWCQLLGLTHVPVLWRGTWDENAIKACWTGKSTQGGEPGKISFFGRSLDVGQEGYVVRLASGFSFGDFGKSMGKHVRKGHVTTSSHWLDEAIIQNGLRATSPGRS